MTDRLREEDVLVRLEGVARTYGSGPAAVVAVHSTSCELFSGQRVAVAGVSGSGKSTLLHLMSGLDVPTAGTATWPALGPRGQLRPGPVAVVFQGPSLLPPLDVLENVALPLVLAGTTESDARPVAMEALESVGLGDVATKLPEELSGGQAQRAAVARVLAGRPRVIFADEPTGQLDHETGALVVDVLLETTARLGAALVLTTHDPLVAERLPAQWQMADGRLETAAGMACSA